MRLSRFRLREAERLPWWSGIAWFDYFSHTAIVLPYGLHVVAAWVRFVWFEFKNGAWPSLIDEARIEAFQRGREESRLQWDSVKAYYINTAYKLGREDGFKVGAAAQKQAAIDAIDQFVKSLP